MLTRRATILGIGCVLVLPRPAAATPEEVRASIIETFGPGALAEGPIELELPPLAESGNSVPLTVRVPQGGVRRLALFTEQNPRPKACEAIFGPASAETSLTTNIRLASTQFVICVAEMSDGSLMTARHEVRVVVGACSTLPSRY